MTQLTTSDKHLVGWQMGDNFYLWPRFNIDRDTKEVLAHIAETGDAIMGRLDAIIAAVEGVNTTIADEAV